MQQNRQQRINPDGTEYHGPSMSGTEVVPTEWKSAYEMATQQKVWPHIKFITCPSMLDYGSTAWHIVMDNITVAHTEEDRRLMWNDKKAQQWVEKLLVQKRNNINGCICRQFKGW